MGMSLVFMTLYLMSFFLGLLASESCRINGHYRICDEDCCTGNPNYCCDSTALSIGAIFGIVVGCVAGIIILCCIFVICVKNLGSKNTAIVPNTTRALPTYQPPGTYTPQPFPVGGQGQSFQFQQYPDHGQSYTGQGQQYPGQGQQYPGQPQPLRSTQSPNPTQGGSFMSNQPPPPYSEVVGPNAPAYGFTQDVQPMPQQNSQAWSSGYSNQGFNNEGIPERTNLKPSAP